MEEENNKKITIADVAKLAGVSKGTVSQKAQWTGFFTTAAESPGRAWRRYGR